MKFSPENRRIYEVFHSPRRHNKCTVCSLRYSHHPVCRRRECRGLFSIPQPPSPGLRGLFSWGSGSLNKSPHRLFTSGKAVGAPDAGKAPPLSRFSRNMIYVYARATLITRGGLNFSLLTVTTCKQCDCTGLDHVLHFSKGVMDLKLPPQKSGKGLYEGIQVFAMYQCFRASKF